MISFLLNILIFMVCFNLFALTGLSRENMDGEKAYMREETKAGSRRRGDGIGRRGAGRWPPRVEVRGGYSDFVRAATCPKPRSSNILKTKTSIRFFLQIQKQQVCCLEPRKYIYP